jgi:hypothetical protein
MEVKVINREVFQSHASANALENQIASLMSSHGLYALDRTKLHRITGALANQIASLMSSQGLYALDRTKLQNGRYVRRKTCLRAKRRKVCIVFCRVAHHLRCCQARTNTGAEKIRTTCWALFVSGIAYLDRTDFEHFRNK